MAKATQPETPKVVLSELNASILDEHGEHVTARTAKEQARKLVDEARRALPAGVPDESPYKRLTHDQCLAEAARLEMRLGPLMSEDELRLVIEVMRQKMTRGDIRAPAPQPETPMQPAPPPRRIRGLKPSASSTWIVKETRETPPLVAIGGGQLVRLVNGTRLELRHYSEKILQGVVDQGVKLIPIEDTVGVDED